MIQINSNILVKSGLGIAVLLLSFSAQAETYDVDSFKPLGFALGNSEENTLKGLAQYSLLDRNDIEVQKQSEKNAPGSAIASRFSKTYKIGPHIMHVGIFPDYVGGKTSELVAGRIEFIAHVKDDAESRKAFYGKVKGRDR